MGITSRIRRELSGASDLLNDVRDPDRFDCWRCEGREIAGGRDAVEAFLRCVCKRGEGLGNRLPDHESGQLNTAVVLSGLLGLVHVQC